MYRVNVILVLSALLILGLVSGNVARAADDAVEHLDQHWRMMLNEPDEKRRLEMMTEHEAMMEKAMRPGNAGMQGHHAGSGHHHMMNSLEMHRSMMDMMK